MLIAIGFAKKIATVETISEIHDLFCNLSILLTDIETVSLSSLNIAFSYYIYWGIHCDVWDCIAIKVNNTYRTLEGHFGFV